MSETEDMDKKKVCDFLKLNRDFIDTIDKLLYKTELLGALEEMLSSFIHATSIKLNGKRKRGIFYLSREDAKIDKMGEDSFYIYFLPTYEEKRKINNNSIKIAMGWILRKKIFFYELSQINYPKYIKKEILPILKDIFIKMDLKIIKTAEELETKPLK
jgi:hypothetical protein